MSALRKGREDAREPGRASLFAAVLSGAMRGYVWGGRIGFPAACAFGVAWFWYGHWFVAATFVVMAVIGSVVAWVTPVGSL